jgi:hypothetical protein
MTNWTWLIPCFECTIRHIYKQLHIAGLQTVRKFNNIGRVRITEHWGAFVQLLLLWKICDYYTTCVLISSLMCLHATHMRHIVICVLPRSTIFSTLSHKRHDFRKNVTEHKMCVLIFVQLLSVTFLIVWRNEREMIKIMYWASCKVPVIFVRF